RSSGDPLLFALLAVLVPAGFGLQTWNVVRKGFGLQRVLRVACWPPKWWGLWWPHPVRRPDDLWDCLPRSTRLTRFALTAFFLLAPTLKLFERREGGHPAGAVGLTTMQYHAVEYGLVSIVALFVVTSLWRLHSRGIPVEGLARLLVG